VLLSDPLSGHLFKRDDRYDPASGYDCRCLVSASGNLVSNMPCGYFNFFS
jgi:hypothetical protein